MVFDIEGMPTIGQFTNDEHLKQLLVPARKQKHMFISSRSCGGRHGRDRMFVGFTTICVISAYHHLRCEFEPRSSRGVLDTT